MIAFLILNKSSFASLNSVGLSKTAFLSTFPHNFINFGSQKTFIHSWLEVSELTRAGLGNEGVNLSGEERQGHSKRVNSHLTWQKVNR